VVGLKLSWDLLSVPRYISEKAAAEKQTELEAQAPAQGQTLAVLTQVRLAVIECGDAADKLPLTFELESKAPDAHGRGGASGELGKRGESLLIDEDSKNTSWPDSSTLAPTPSW